MVYVKNLPMWERSLRIGAGIAVAAYGAFGMCGTGGWAVVALGAGAALTGVLGFCPACALAGRRLKHRTP
jgi:hypothetical protein